MDVNETSERPSVQIVYLEKFCGKIICVDGGIGVGKTMLCNDMVKFMNDISLPVVVVPESINTFLLTKFNTDQKPLALAVQYDMMMKRISSLLKAMEAAEEGKVVILDTGILRDIAFAEANYKMGNFTQSQYENVMAALKDLYTHRILPDYILLLDTNDVDKCKENIAERNRTGEDQLPREYLTAILDCYRGSVSHEIVNNHKEVKVAVYDTSKRFAEAYDVFDYLTNL